MNKIEDNRRQHKIARIRREIEILLHSSLYEEEWNDLEEEQYVEELLDGSITTSEVAEKVRRRREVYGQRKARRSNKPQQKEASGRLKALSILVAQVAAKDSGVQESRAYLFGGGVLPLDEVEGWIQKQSEADGPQTWWVSDVHMPNEYMVETILDPSSKNREISQYQEYFEFDISVKLMTDEFYFHFLKYLVPGSWEYKEIPTNRFGTLEHIRRYSKNLAEEYGWEEAEATLFILTGCVPEIKQAAYSFQPKNIPSLSRIDLTLDPTLSPKEVAEYYRKIRQEVLGARHRDMSEKHLQLAIFATTQPDNLTWAEKMKEWNRSQSADWKYEDVANFAHDCLQARRRLMRSEGSESEVNAKTSKEYHSHESE